MGTLKKDFKYKVINNFLTEDELKICNKYLIMKHRSNSSQFDQTQLSSSTSDSYWYGDPLIESILLAKRERMQKETNLELIPTYGYARVYTYLAALKKHKDRPSCEVSVTVMVGSSGENWPIYVDDNKINLNPGDAVIYLGCELEHWREEFSGDWHSQFFLHYIDKNGPYKDLNLVADGRLFWGVEK
jgi:hypothetical protein